VSSGDSQGRKDSHLLYLFGRGGNEGEGGSVGEGIENQAGRNRIARVRGPREGGRGAFSDGTSF